MSDMDSWTDVQIRHKFEEMGSPVGPVTSTTRRIMLKRLRMLLDNKGKSAAQPQVVEEYTDYDDEPDVAPLPPSRVPKRLGRSAIASLNESQTMETHSTSCVPQRNSFRSEAEVSSTNEKRTKSPGRKSLSRANDLFTTPEVNEEYQHPPRKVTPARKPQDSPVSSEGWAQRELFHIRKSLDRPAPPQELSANEAFRSRIHIDPSSFSHRSFESDFMRKVSSTPPSQGKNFNDDDDDVLSEDEDNNMTSPVLVVRGNKPFGYDLRWDTRGASSTFTPLAVLMAAVSVVLALGLAGSFAQYRVNCSAELTTATDWVFPACTDSPSDRVGVNCVNEGDRALVFSMAKALYQGLDDLRLGSPCTTSPSSPVFVVNDALKEIIVARDRTTSAWLSEKTLPDVKIMIDANPQLNLRSKHDGIALLRGPDTYICFLWSQTVFIAEWVVRIGLAGIAAAVLFTTVRWYLTHQQKRQEDVSSAVDKLLDLLKTRKFIAIAQVNDELASCFKPNVIADALKLTVEDSRVRVEAKNNVEGIRWVGGDISETESPWGISHTTPIEVPVNAYVVPPTSCLKIRGLFSPTKQVMSDEVIVKIVDDILEKSIGNRIVHIVVDRKSPDGIVYLRGLTKADAGGVFRRLNGTFYNGKPIIVKYIREVRYDEKFPTSASHQRPLHPSTRF